MTWRRLAIFGYAALVGFAIFNTGCSRSDATVAKDEAAGAKKAPAAAARIITVGGAITETVFALGLGDRVVAIDTSSTFPPDAMALPRIGYQRTLAAETVLSFRPELVIAAPEAGPASAIEQLRTAGVRVELVAEAHDGKSAAARIRALGKLLGKEAEAEKLAAPLETVVAPAPAAKPPRVLFLYARGGGVAMVAGEPSPISEMIKLGGGVNAITEFSGYKPLAGEAVIAAAPDIILLPERGLASIGGPDKLWQMPGMAQTPAGIAKRVVAIEDLLLLGFGPRLPDAVEQLRTAFAASR